MTVAELCALLRQYPPETEVRVFVQEFREALHVGKVSCEWMRTKYPGIDRIYEQGKRWPRVKYQKQVVVIF